MGYLSIRQTAEKWNLSARWISDLCNAGRIPGAMKVGSYWAIPENAESLKMESQKQEGILNVNEKSLCGQNKLHYYKGVF